MKLITIQALAHIRGGVVMNPWWKDGVLKQAQQQPWALDVRLVLVHVRTDTYFLLAHRDFSYQGVMKMDARTLT